MTDARNDIGIETAIDAFVAASRDVDEFERVRGQEYRRQIEEIESRYAEERIVVYGKRKQARNTVATLLQDMGLTGFSLRVPE